MKFFICLAVSVFVVVTGTGICQPGNIPTSHDYQNFTPVNLDPEAKIEKLSVLHGRSGAFILINNKGVHSIAMYVGEPVFEWYNIPAPSTKTEIVDMDAGSDGVFALQRDGAGQTISYFYGTKWSNISTKPLNGEITMINGYSNVYLYAVGNFSQDGRPYHLAVYDYSKKWKPLTGADEALFENNTIKKIAIVPWTECLLLQNNSTGKFSIVCYDEGKHKWELLGPVPGPVNDMVYNSSNEVYICGTEEGSGKPYLQRWIHGPWEKIPLDGVSITRPEILDVGDNTLTVYGPAKNSTFYTSDYLLGSKWNRSAIIAPANIKMMGGHISPYIVTEENGKTVFYRPQGEARKSASAIPSLKGPPPGTIYEMEAIARKKKAKEDYDIAIAEIHKVYPGVTEVMEAYRIKRAKYPLTKIYGLGGIDDGKTLAYLDEVIVECNDVMADLLFYYQGKLKEVKVKEEETALAAAFEKYLAAFVTMVKNVHDDMVSFKNIAATTAREGRPASSNPKTLSDAMKKGNNKDIASMNQALEEVNRQWNLYFQKKNVKTDSSYFKGGGSNE